MSPPAAPPRSHQREVLEAHIAGSPPLSDWLARPSTVEMLDRLDKAEARATRRQARYFRMARRATICSTLGTAIAAIFLLPIETLFHASLPKWVGLLQLFCVLLALACIWSISWRHLLDRWMEARARAEERRSAVFQELMQASLPAPQSGKPALVAQLAAFEACHFDYQRGYYRKRGAQLTKAAGSMAPIKLVGYATILASVAVSVIVGVGLMSEMGIEVPSWLQFISSVKIPDSARVQLGLGALASSALSFAAAWTLINQDDRNASRYAATLRKLDAFREQELPLARKAAEEGRVADVLAFTRAAQWILGAEHAAWVAARPPENPAAGPGPALNDAV